MNQTLPFFSVNIEKTGGDLGMRLKLLCSYMYMYVDHTIYRHGANFRIFPCVFVLGHIRQPLEKPKIQRYSETWIISRK